jgi:pimeloyl-ACP methyl ester carboxylesterase
MIRRAYADGPFGQIHYASCGDGDPLLLLHQTPRSWDEFAAVMTILEPSRRTIAMDLPGMGASDAPPGEPTIEAFGEAAVALLDQLGIESADVCGHHTGSFVAAHLAAHHPSRVRSVTLSAPSWADDAQRAGEGDPDHLPVDNAAPVADGGHLAELWNQRQPYYPADRVDLMSTFMRDALRVEDPRAGHMACARYPIDRAGARIECPVLLLFHDEDPHSFGDLDEFTARMPDAAVEIVAGGMVPLELSSERVAAALDGFLSR